MGCAGSHPAPTANSIFWRRCHGKSLVELHLCVAHVLGRDWLGSLPEIGAAIYCGAEDEKDELRRRLTLIASHYQTTFADLTEGGLHILSLAGQDALLAVPDRNGKIVPTALFNQLLEATCDIKPKHVGIDTSADVFGGNENDRTQVRQFVGLLRKLAIAGDTSVVLLSHPSLTGISTGSGLSGSTGWHNSVRARMYLTSPKAENGEQPDTDLRELSFKKNNYGPISNSVVLRYKDGLFLPEPGMSSLNKLAREVDVDDAFITIAKKLESRGQELSPAQTSHSYAPTVIAKQPEAKGIKKSELVAAQDRLLNQGKLLIETTKPGTTREKKVIRVEAAGGMSV